MLQDGVKGATTRYRWAGWRSQACAIFTVSRMIFRRASGDVRRERCSRVWRVTLAAFSIGDLITLRTATGAYPCSPAAMILCSARHLYWLLCYGDTTCTRAASARVNLPYCMRARTVAGEHAAFTSGAIQEHVRRRGQRRRGQAGGALLGSCLKKWLNNRPDLSQGRCIVCRGRVHGSERVDRLDGAQDLGSNVVHGGQ